MKKILVTLLTILTLSLSCLAANQASADKPFSVIHSGANQLKLNLSAPQPQIKATEQAGRTVSAVTAEGTQVTADDGMPQLPIFSTIVAIPPRGNYTLDWTYSGVDYTALADPLVYIPEDGSDTDLPAPTGVYPSTIVNGSEPAILRDFRVVRISVYPYQYDAETHQLRHYQNVQVTLNFTGGTGINETQDYSTYSYAFQNIYESNIANFADYRNLVMAPAQARILIIYGNSTDTTFQSKLNEFIAWKRQKGYEVNYVSTANTGGTSNTAIKNYIQSQYNNLVTRPDYVILLGDTSGSYSIPTWYETWSSYQGEGDYPYTHLAGGDLLGDVFIGRISAENISQLATLFSKIYTYEKNINTTGTAAAWLDRMLLIGDPSSSGISTVYTNRYIHEMSAEFNPDYTYIENYTGGYSNTINTGINQGVGFFHYRGYIGMSGWAPSSSLSNGPRLPHAVIITCGTGSFAGTSTTEDFIRLGTEAAPKGALTAIGMSTTGTHTLFNNALSCGIFDGVFIHHMRSMGEALLNGKLYMWQLYGDTHPTQANYFSHWCNLMGDPTVEAFVSIPGNLNIISADTLPVGTTFMDVTAVDDTQNPVADVSVTAYNTVSASVVAKGFTDELGVCTLNIPASVGSGIIITVSKHDFKPAQKNVSMDMNGSLVFYDKTVTDNGSFGSVGNGDAYVEAGETIALKVEIKNTTANMLTGISGVITSADPLITVVQGQSAFPDTDSNQSNVNSAYFLFTVNTNIPAFHNCRFELTLTDSANVTYSAIFHLGGYNANVNVSNYGISAGGNAILDPSETGILTINATNSSIFGVTDIYGELRSLNDLIVVTDSLAFYGSIPANMTVNSVDGYGLFARPLLIPGMQIAFRMRFYNSNGFEQVSYFNIPVGTVSQHTPLGPDEYGYFIYDVSDTNYPDCPTYDWIEIVPSLGGSGSQITGYSDQGTSGDEGDQVGCVVLQTVDLPFTFPFYGVEYNQITVCLNGFIVLGTTNNGEFRNGRMPGGQGPSPMIAPFWDDLIMLTGGGIYRWYDSNNHLFVIQYNNLKNGYNRTSEETFQVIFYDPLFYPTSMGDGMVKMQYKVFNNVDVGGGGYSPLHGSYCTVGIRDPLNARGLEYTFNNQYPPAAQPLANNKALLITTVPILHQNAHLVVGEMILNDANGNSFLEPGESAEVGVKLNNLGLNSATNVQMSATSLNPHLTVQNNTSTFPDIPGSGSAVNIAPITITAAADCTDGQVLAMEFTVTIDGNSWTYPLSVAISKPLISVSGVYLNDIQGNSNGLADPNETFSLIVNYTNTGTVDAFNLTSNVTCISTEVTIANPMMLIPEVAAGATAQAAYEITLSPNVLVGNNITFYLTYLGDMIEAQNSQILLNVGTTGMMCDFENDDGMFVASPSTNGWQWGTDSTMGAHSGTHVWGTLLNQQYPNNITWTLTSPTVFIGGNFMLDFWQNFNTELNYDGGNVKISTNNGGSWTTLTPIGGYTQQNVAALNGPGYAGNSGGWVEAQFNLSTYANQTVRFRWTFCADNMIQGQGWYIDDVQTTGFIPFAGKLSGVVTSSNPDINLTRVFIQNNNSILTQPDAQGNYQLYLPAGTHTVTASAAGYLSESLFPVNFSTTSPSMTHDFMLGYFSPVTDLDKTIAQDSLLLTWNAPAEPLFPVVNYKVYRRINAGRYELMGIYPDTYYQEDLVLLGSYHYYVVACYTQGESEGCDPEEFEYPYVSNDDPGNPPLVSRLYQNYPNPFNPTTTVMFDLAKAEPVKLSIYNVRGQLVRKLVEGQMNPGTHRVVWDGKDAQNRSVGSGIYFIRIEANDLKTTRKAILMK
jgi:hypothetical protein